MQGGPLVAGRSHGLGGGMTGWSQQGSGGRRMARLRLTAVSCVLSALALGVPGRAAAQVPLPGLAVPAHAGSSTWLARLEAPPQALPHDALLHDAPLPDALPRGAPLRDAPLHDALPPAEPALRQAVLQALWPADIVRLADAYLGRFAAQDWCADARRLREQARQTALLLRRPDVQLFRSAFAGASAGDLAASDLRLAALGDAAAALRLAQPTAQLEAGSKRQLGWLQFAAALGSEQAAYALALHYRRLSQPLLAAQHEAQALALGLVPPLSLDHVRK